MEGVKETKAKSIAIFESNVCKDKGPDGFRKETMPIVNSIKSLGWNAEVIKFENEKADLIFEDVVARFGSYISRINPGSLPDNEVVFFQTLRRLSSAGLVGMVHPDSMENFGSKAALVKLNKTGLVPEDTYAYFDIDSMRERLPISLSLNERVLKQNRGSIGSGIWRVQVVDERFKNHKAGHPLPLDTELKVTEAYDNHVEYHKLGDFLTFCEKYFVGENGLMVDMRFLPRIVEGEIRILCIGATPAFVVQKIPAKNSDAFSATTTSGATQTYHSIEEFQSLIKFFLKKLTLIKAILKEKELPLIWSADFILDKNEDQTDKYVLGEINCSCLGFSPTNFGLNIQDLVAKEAIRQVLEN